MSLVRYLGYLRLGTNTPPRCHVAEPNGIEKKTMGDGQRDPKKQLGKGPKRTEGVGKGTTDKEKRTWRRWCEYCSIIQNDHDVYLQNLSPEFRTRLFGAFAVALRRRQFSRPGKNPLGASIVEETVAKLGQIFRANVGYNPAHGIADNGMHPSLARQIKGMKNNDPGEKRQKALPVCVYREIYRQAQSPSAIPQDKTIAWLQVLAFFFCMQSCEYSHTKGESPDQAFGTQL